MKKKPSFVDILAIFNFFRSQSECSLIHEIYDSHNGNYNGFIDVLDPNVAAVLRHHNMHDISSQDTRNKLAFIQGIIYYNYGYVDKMHKHILNTSSDAENTI